MPAEDVRQETGRSNIYPMRRSKQFEAHDCTGQWRVGRTGKDRHEAERGNHAIHARDARERAVIVLRLLAGEDEWGDGYERKLDDCFEMNDGDAVCGWLIEFAEADPRIHRLLFNHYNCGQSFQKHWAKYRNAHRAGELALA